MLSRQLQFSHFFGYPFPELKEATDNFLTTQYLPPTQTEIESQSLNFAGWGSFKREGVGIGTLGAIAKEHGWKGKDRVEKREDDFDDQELKTEIKARFKPVGGFRRIPQRRSRFGSRKQPIRHRF